MDIRVATEADFPAILELFQVSLGVDGGIPEPEFWRWKHYQNPFGESPTLLAFDGERLVGLRTFLRWQFRYQNKVFNAFRAVDTATHPQYRGKGIFKKLTLDLVDQIKKGEPAVIFNTPNESSRPGYLKMGWNIMGKTPLSIMVTPRYWFGSRKEATSNADVRHWTELEIAWDRLYHGYSAIFRNCISTNYSLAFLRWRYRDIPGFRYYSHFIQKNDKSCAIIYRIKHSGRLRELRVTDTFFSHRDRRLMQHGLSQIIEQTKPDVVTMLRDGSGIISSIQPCFFIPMKRMGLTMTYRDVNDPILTSLAGDFTKWYFSAGTIELL